MEKDTKILIGAVAILLVVFLISGPIGGITGMGSKNVQAFWLWRILQKRKVAQESPTIESAVRTPVAIDKCTDSDGLNLGIKGFTKDAQTSYYDKCWNDFELTEYYCYNNKLYAQPYNCPTNYECKDGACIEKITKECEDTDKGKKPFIKGMTICDGSKKEDICRALTFQEAAYAGLTPEFVYDFTDNCEIPKLGTVFPGQRYVVKCYVVEKYCENGVSKSENILCESGRCVDGKCVELTEEEPKLCIDSDGGKNEFERGTVTTIKDGRKYEDSCVARIGSKSVWVNTCTLGEISFGEDIGSGTETFRGIAKKCSVWEGYCSEIDQLKQELITCPGGCRAGACIQ